MADLINGFNWQAVTNSMLLELKDPRVHVDVIEKKALVGKKLKDI